MYIDGFKKNSENKQEKKPDVKTMDDLEFSEEKYTTKYTENVLAHWQAPEFEMYEQDNRWLVYIALALVAIVAYAIYMDSLIMAVTFILIGVTGYIYTDKEPRILDFMITNGGIVAGNEIFKYENIKSFWIFYESEGKKIVSLHMKNGFVPYMHIPIDNEDPVIIREILLRNIEEVKQEWSFVDILEDLLHI